MVALAAACSGSSSSDDDDDDDDDSSSSGKGGSSGRGGSSSVGSGGTGAISGSGGSFLSKCKELCAESNACPGSEPTDCTYACAQINELVTSNECGPKIETFYDCLGDAPDICATETDICQAEALDVVDCVTAFCTANPNDDFCAGE